MPLRVSCPQCEAVYNLADDKIGKMIRCPKCRDVFRAEPSSTALTARRPADEDAPAPRKVPPRSRDVEAPPKGTKGLAFLLLGGCGVVLLLLLACGGVAGYFVYAGNPWKKPPDKKPDDAAYTLKLKGMPDVGKSVRITSTETFNFTIQTAAGGPPQVQQKQSTQERVYTRVVLEGGTPRPREFRETYEKATDSEAPAGTLAYQGRTITYDLQGEEYRVTPSPGNPLAAKDVKSLTRHAKQVTTDEALLPKMPVRVGETWTPDVKAAGEPFAGSGEINPALSTIRAKLDKVIEKNGKQFAVVTVDMNLSISKLEEFPPDMVWHLEGKGTMEFALDGSETTGSSSFTGRIETHYVAERAGMRVTLDLTGELRSKDEHSAETKAP
jgi:predicted Zn finger-like uncharacterized protein